MEELGRGMYVQTRRGIKR